MKTLSIDLETYSDVDLGKSGVYPYSESEEFQILLFGYSVDGGPVQVVDLICGDQIPQDVLSALTDPAVLKFAYNANFERVCLSRYLHDLGIFDNGDYCQGDDTVGYYLDPASWRCTMVWGGYNGLPMKLSECGAALGLDKQKMSEGADLIRFFCRPCKPTKSNGGRTRNLPQHDLNKWRTFKEYNRRDVEVEQSIQQRLQRYPVPDTVWSEYAIDQKINDRGVRIDQDLVAQAIRIDEVSKSSLLQRMQDITHLENPNSVLQMKDWLAEHGVMTDTLGKKAVAELIDTVTPEVREVLELRQQASKSSTKKYITMQNALCLDGRVRGMFQFYGANRTGRFAGRLVQLQNLPQNHLEELVEARTITKAGDFRSLDMLYDSVPQVLSELIRTAFIPKPGYKYIVSDYAAIEARVIAWYAGETWRQEAFANGEDIYCASASAMFHVPVEKHGVNGHLRQRGKVAELALGYGGSCGALRAMGALSMGMEESELQPLVDMWREASPKIVAFWQDVDNAARDAIAGRRTVKLRNLMFSYYSGMLFIALPSGRKLAYAKPYLTENRFGVISIGYWGTGTARKWEQQETYGAKIVENIVQATSRDILCYAMKNLKDQQICMHIHDELVIEVPESTPIEAITSIMGQTPPWAEGLLLRADGYDCHFYQKD